MFVMYGASESSLGARGMTPGLSTMISPTSKYSLTLRAALCCKPPYPCISQHPLQRVCLLPSLCILVALGNVWRCGTDMCQAKCIQWPLASYLVGVHCRTGRLRRPFPFSPSPITRPKASPLKPRPRRGTPAVGNRLVSMSQMCDAVHDHRVRFAAGRPAAAATPLSSPTGEVYEGEGGGGESRQLSVSPLRPATVSLQPLSIRVWNPSQ